MRVVRSDGSVRTVQEFIPDLFTVARDGVRDGERLAARPGTRWYEVEGDAIGKNAMAGGAKDVPDRVEALRSRQRREVPERTSSRHRSDTPRQDDTGITGRSTAVGNQDDARTLWIDRNGKSERYKTWRTVCQESRQVDHAGLALGGERTALHVATMMERQGGDPRLWAERWLREKGIERDSRTGRELSVLTNALYQGGVYDQLNVGGVGCLEVICRRVAVLVEAHSQPSRPNWKAARQYLLFCKEQLVAVLRDDPHMAHLRPGGFC